MKTKMQIVDNYITNYEFFIKRKLLPNEQFTMDGNLGFRTLKPEEKEKEILIGLELKNDILLRIKNEENTELGRINATMIGVFAFDKGTEEKEMEKLLKINGVSILYQQLRAYINANTALSQSIPNIILPTLNFTENKK